MPIFFNQKKLRESKKARWTAMTTVAVTMLFSCYFTDVMAPLKPMLESELGWRSDDYGLFTSAYGWFIIFFFMLIAGGIILDRIGIRYTGIISTSIMIIGAGIKYWAIATTFPEGATIAGIKLQVVFASIGFAVYGVGAEITFISFSKIIVKWFKGKELALAMGLQVSVVRMAIILSMMTPIPLVRALGSISALLIFCLALLFIGFLFFLVYCVMDKQLDRELGENIKNKDKNLFKIEGEDSFKLASLASILKKKDFLLISLTCFLFYACIFPFLKYAVDLMINKFHVPIEFAGNIPAILPIGTLLLTPIFGHLNDRKGKGASMIVLGALLLTLVHTGFALPFVQYWPIAVILMLLMGIALSLVPSALWPMVPKIIKDKQLGTAYSLIFYMQNIGISVVSFVIGKILNSYCITGVNAVGGYTYDYTLPMVVFAVLSGLSFFAALMLKKNHPRTS